jgi:hypothetical protein
MKSIVARAVASALAAAAIVGLAPSAGALECPEAQPGSHPGVITETPVQIAELAPVLAGGDVSAQLPTIVAALQKRYPSAGSAEIANYLITAYCPGVAKATGLDDAQKAARVQAFSKAVLAVLY